MARYAQKECYDCLRVFPGNQMVRVSEERRAYSTREGRMRRHQEGNFAFYEKTPSRTTTHTSTRERLICRGCGVVGGIIVYNDGHGSRKRTSASRIDPMQSRQEYDDPALAEDQSPSVPDDEGDSQVSQPMSDADTPPSENVSQIAVEDASPNSAAAVVPQSNVDREETVLKSDLTAF